MTTTRRPRLEHRISTHLTDSDRERLERAASAIGLLPAGLMRALVVAHLDRVDRGEVQTFAAAVGA